MQTIEILAPAKDLESGLAAINCGADAVYIGAPRFGAREAAGNSLQDIEQLAAYAHKFWARVYVTVNTLMTDEELEEAQTLVNQIHSAGADAIIIQDTGLLELKLPPIPLFASTQMHNHNPERVSFLEKVGFQRAILARELSLPQIRAIRAATKLELETFIHGALCVGYSGQCLLSYALGGRSGNRGQCAQPCRRAYDLLDKNGAVLMQNRHLLSLRDLNLTDHLRELLEAGICSFKIEGRLKGKDYVMNVVAHYRRALDQILKDFPAKPAASGRIELDFTPDPVKSFNRGFTNYFLTGRQPNLGSLKTPKSTGEPLGKVISLDKRSFTLPAEAPELHPADGICFFNLRHELVGTIVNAVEGQRIFPAKMTDLVVGAQIFRNHDQHFTAFLNKSQAARKIGLNLRLSQTANGLRLEGTDEDHNQAPIEIEQALSAAEKPAQALETLQKQLRKLGETDFVCAQLALELNGTPFIPVGVLNNLRRELIAQLVQVRSANRIVWTGGAIQNNYPFPEHHLTYFGNVLNRMASNFYHRHGVEIIQPAAESGLNMLNHKVMTTKYCLKFQLGACPKQKDSRRLPEPLFLRDENNRRFALRFNCIECQMEIDLIS
jgi:putative protease